MRKRIRDYIDNCIPCLMANSSINKSEGRLQLSSLPEAPFENVHIDHFGPLQETENGYRYIFVVVDAFTRYTWLFATKTKIAKEVTLSLQFLFQIFGKLRLIISDRGSAFTSNKFSKFLQEADITLSKVTVTSPWSNGIVERVNKFLKSSLTKVIDSPSS